MGVEQRGLHQGQRFGVGFILGRNGDTAEAIIPSTRGVAPVIHCALDTAKCAEGFRHMATRFKAIEFPEEIGRIQIAEAIYRSPLREIIHTSFLAEGQASGDDEHNFVRVEGGGEATEFNAPDGLHLAEVDQSIFSNVDAEIIRRFSIIDIFLLALSGDDGRPLREITAFCVLSVKNWRHANTEASKLFAPVADISRRVRTTSRTSVNSHMNSTLGRTRVANWAFRTNRFEEVQEFKNVLHPSVTLEDGGDEFTFTVVTECADRGVFVRFPTFTSEPRGVDHATIGESNLRYILAVTVIPDADADVAGNLSFNFNSECGLLVDHVKTISHSNPLRNNYIQLSSSDLERISKIVGTSTPI